MSEELKIKFNSFHAQNIQTVNQFTNNMQAHPVDRNALEAWRTEMLRRLEMNYEGRDLENLSEFVNRFANNLTNISSVEFLTNFNIVLGDAIERLATKPKHIIILTMESEVNKSSIWVSLLAWDKLRDIVTYVMSFVDIYYYIKSHPDELVSILYIDDATYSGKQCTANITFDILGRSTEIRRNIEILFVIPYVSFTARNIIHDKITMCQIWISNKAITFQKLYTEKEDGKTYISRKHLQFWTDYFGNQVPIPNVFALYFDHKLPDRVSVYTQIIAYSPLIPEIGYNFDDVQLGNGFITGCTRNTRNPMILYKGKSADREIPLCPQPVYKLLGYTFNDNHIRPREDLLEWLRINNYMCGNCGIEANFFSGDITFCGKSCQVAWYHV